MSLKVFLTQLCENGRVKVPNPNEQDGREFDGADALLRDMDHDARSELAFQPPAFHPAAALWAATLFYRAAQFFVFRPDDPNRLRKTFDVACPAPPSTDVVYSADLTLCYLPDLVSLARAADYQSLVEELTGLGRVWPLSSVGMSGLGEVDCSAFIDQLALKQLYVDRIIARRDVSRLSDSRVRDAVRAALGAFPSLAPEFADSLAG